MVQIGNKYLVVSSQKNSFWALKKWKMKFSSKENENFLRQHCWSFRYAPLCTIWDHLSKLCHECYHNSGHLPWMPWIFIHDSSFRRTFSQDICRSSRVLFFLNTKSHIMTQCEGFQFFWFFFEFLMPVSKCDQVCRYDRSYLGVEYCETFGVSMMK